MELSREHSSLRVSKPRHWPLLNHASCGSALVLLLAATSACLVVGFVLGNVTSAPSQPAAVVARAPHQPSQLLKTSVVQLLRPVWWHAPFLQGLSYSTDAVSLALALLKTEEVAPQRLWLSQHSQWGSTGSGNTLHEVLQLNSSTRNALLDLMSVPRPPSLVKDSIVICHSPAGCWSRPGPDSPAGFNSGEHACPPVQRGEAAYLIGRTMTEAATLAPSWVERMNAMDELWVPSEYNRQLFRREGVVTPEIHLMPIIVETGLWDPERHTPLSLAHASRVLGSGPASLAGEEGGTGTGRPFLFLSSFTWEKRKGYDVLLRAYLEEFRVTGTNSQQQQQRKEGGQAQQQAQQQPRVALLVKALPRAGSGFNSTQKILDWVQQELGVSGEQMAGLPPIYDLQGSVPYEDLPRLYKAADAFVFPTRGEGWGLPIVEAMSMGLPVIATNWSAPTDYLDETVAFPLATDGMEHDGSNLCKPSVEHLRRLMRQVVEQPQEAAKRGRAARERMLARYSPAIVGRRVAARLTQIEGKLSSGGKGVTSHEAGEGVEGR